MRIVQLILLFMFGLLIRRFFRALKMGSQPRNPRQGNGSHSDQGNETPAKEALRDITEQEIDDADFEEIP
jgi:hypothetical protein